MKHVVPTFAVRTGRPTQANESARGRGAGWRVRLLTPRAVWIVPGLCVALRGPIAYATPAPSGSASATQAPTIEAASPSTSIPATPRGSPPTAGADARSVYERQALHDATSALDLELEPAPEAKRVEGVDVVRLPVFDAHDPVPDWINYFHATSTDEIIRREVLLEVGAPFRQARCDETARNLRRLAQLSLVLCAATRGRNPDQVRVLIITKDVWSLRMSWEILTTRAGVEYLRLEPSETNLAGRHQVLRARYVLQPASHGFGAGYIVQRIADTRVAASADATAYVNRTSGGFEGSSGTVQAQQPLYATFARSAWHVQAAWYDSEQRVYEGLHVKLDPKGIPIQYHRRHFLESASYTLSYGTEIKHDITFGAEMSLRNFTVENRTGASEPDFDAFVAKRVPVSERRVGPFVQYRNYANRFARTWDHETLGLEENYRLGTDFTVRLYPVTTALGSTHDFLGNYAALFYSLQLGDGLLRAGVESTIEPATDRVLNAAFRARFRVASPRLPLGRLVFDAELLDRYRNRLNRLSYMGGDSRLRGYPTSAFSGESMYAANLEFRTRPVQLFSIQVGAVAFYDVGNAVDSFSTLSPRSSLGAGVRMLFPQFDKIVLRLDAAFPLQRDPWPSHQQGRFPIADFVLALDQAFELGGASSTVGAPPNSRALGPTTGWLGQ